MMDAMAPDDLTLLPKRSRWITFLIIGLVFTGGSLGLAISESDLLGWAGVGLFGLVTIVSAWFLVPGAAYLKLGRDGFVARAPFRTQRYGWDEITRFEAYSVHTQYTSTKVVGFGLRDREPSLWRRLNRNLDKKLPDNYGYEAGQLAALMDGYRTRYGVSRSS
jgi:hypothetical protein